MSGYQGYTFIKVIDRNVPLEIQYQNCFSAMKKYKFYSIPKSTINIFQIIQKPFSEKITLLYSRNVPQFTQFAYTQSLLQSNDSIEKAQWIHTARSLAHDISVWNLIQPAVIRAVGDLVICPGAFERERFGPIPVLLDSFRNNVSVGIAL